MIPWSDFAPRCAAFAPDVPAFSVADEAIRSARTYFDDTRAWRAYSIAIGTTVAAQASYAWGALPADAEVCGVTSLWLGGRKVAEAQPGAIEELEPGKAGTVERVRHTSAGIQLLPAPSYGGEAMVVTLALMPAAASLGLDDALYLQHSEAIVHHILAIVKMHEGKPYSNPASAAAHEREYKRLAMDASSAAGPRTTGPYRTRMSPI
jgi:hypothetical protein